MKRIISPLGSFSSGTNLGGKVSRYREKQNIYSQGEPAHTLFYIQEGGVRLTTRTKHQPSAVTASWVCMISLANFASRAIRFVCPRPSR
jgi:CRP-like cAMP-binding protein